MSEERNSRKVRQGVVVSISGDKTCVVQVHERKPHPVYGKMVNSTKKFHAHDQNNEAGVGNDYGNPPAFEDEALASSRYR